MFYGYEIDTRCIVSAAPDISVYASHCISRRRHTKRRLRQYGRIG